jgi:hypothetical protein
MIHPRTCKRRSRSANSKSPLGNDGGGVIVSYPISALLNLLFPRDPCSETFRSNSL